MIQTGRLSIAITVECRRLRRAERVVRIGRQEMYTKFLWENQMNYGYLEPEEVEDNIKMDIWKKGCGDAR